MKIWLEEAFATMTLSSEATDYCLGRGLREARIQDIGLMTWDASKMLSDAPDRVFREGDGEKRYGFGPRGHRLNGRLCTPLRNPCGQLVGFEARTWADKKHVSQYLLPGSAWNPVLIGVTSSTMQKLWAGGDAWVGEGLFDMGAMEHVVPETDAVFATLRARVSTSHVTFFRRFCRGWVNMVYDNDETGRRQTVGYVDTVDGKRRWGALEVFERAGVKARDVPYRGGKDPGEIWEKQGTVGLQRAFGNIF